MWLWWLQYTLRNQNTLWLYAWDCCYNFFTCNCWYNAVGNHIVVPIYHEKKSTLKVGSYAWIIQHGINTTGFGLCCCWFFTTRSWSIRMVWGMFVLILKGWNLWTVWRQSLAKAFINYILFNQERKLGDWRRSDTVVVSTINDDSSGCFIIL